MLRNIKKWIFCTLSEIWNKKKKKEEEEEEEEERDEVCRSYKKTLILRLPEKAETKSDF